MCGIVTAIARRNIVPVLLEGLRKLEYRGYDSAGLAVLKTDGAPALQRLRAVGRVAELSAQADATALSASIGIAHTRWATHGVPSERNAHPHISGGLAVVHNGIIENFEELRAALQAKGYVFTSETDTEAIAHLLHDTLKTVSDLYEAVRVTIAQLVGAYAIGIVSEAYPDRVIVARKGSPLLLGIGEDGHYAASDTAALLQVTRKVVYLEDGDVAELTLDGYRVTLADGTPVERPVNISSLSADAVELGKYRHYMQKEIFEQPQALANTLEPIAGAGAISPQIFGAEAVDVLKATRRVLILACGTSYHSGFTARYWLESVARIPCTVEIASEYRYRESVPDPDTLVVVISQSGETADTLAALKHAKGLGMTKTLAICNVPESAIVRESALRLITRAGPEIGVASTKAFTTQLAALALLALTLAKINGRLGAEQESGYLTQLRHLPVAVAKVLELEPEIEKWAQRFAGKHHALFLGRGSHWPIAMEGALKLKEISYIHAESYAAGELKHGPLALVDKEMPVIAVAPADELLEKLKSNLQEVRARGGELYVFADAGSEIPESEGVHILHMPEHYGMLSPILHVIPLQLLSYHAALVKGTDVDKPRNLAKSVTVE
ncbi:MAG TPA: glutamine--fructose-6-phosphate transaminase (isomerizing) [Rhodocyclaceae bacterium]|uniref:glutamine--fructose-6-phosphate transaminase (isomerizing) n=2 Tax=Zoogloea sp. TaxID=49181 RepID=UPI002B7A2FC4|nr:glutamine--fructose-6-phosphate transaminase (isomerizing) [Zoogloea sp.]HMZ76267.1 glutamine--fructose-6-phosphate transaminase (isomerizing) [Rhodocyclaceae bacterium]HNA68248.1 glutamine--fructose-6-phosphate transaminase (isomerizing) [Rhodocyclaceae bacterium]HNB65366.1 glutamine--fructose-6-phosphate transaminase (isomerizing) [Rhodocyclaceae bacterium]HNC80229.1 glutamine--fructose-6-phosphate transaminase (isomerizing) [Rhodocyclaceae bacterium]HNF62369.1 glutamine--fructose-6-phosp